MKKLYVVPSAEILVFAPTEYIAATNVSDSDKWWLPTTGINYWGVDIPSATNVWYQDFGLGEINDSNSTG